MSRKLTRPAAYAAVMLTLTGAIGVVAPGDGSATAPLRSAGSDACDEAGGRTVIENEYVRVLSVRFDEDEYIDTCDRRTGQRNTIVFPGTSGLFRGEAIELAGPVLGYAVVFCDAACVVTLNTEQFGSEGPARSVEPRRRGRAAIGSLVVKRNHALAWIECPRGEDEPYGSRAPACTRPGALDFVYRLDHDTGRRRLLDRGRDIDPRSLRIRGSRLTWRADGRTRRGWLR